MSVVRWCCSQVAARVHICDAALPNAALRIPHDENKYYKNMQASTVCLGSRGHGVLLNRRRFAIFFCCH